MKFSALIKKPSAVLPVLLSLTALGIVLLHVALFGVAREADEGTAAHLWQALMVAQVPIVLFFAIKWVPQARRTSLLILVLQIGAAVAAATPVFLLKL